MTHYDLFNGDADGICALHQLRLAAPRDGELVTGVKRDIALLPRIADRVGAGDRVTVLDVSVAPNADALKRVLDRGAAVEWFDHHHPGPDLPTHPAFVPHLDTAPETCTSAIVDAHLGGRYRAWAVAAAFGDGLPATGHALADALGLAAEARDRLARLGEAINYNAYGETVADLHIHPADLYRRISAYEDPFGFQRDDPLAGQLQDALAADLSLARSLTPAMAEPGLQAYVLPDAAWARRVSGPFANEVAIAHPGDAVAVLTASRSGDYVVSVRAPRHSPCGADELCRRFPTGGGRQAAGGINRLPADRVPTFLADFRAHFHPA